MTVKRRAGVTEVIVAGSVYWDLIFFNLNEPPPLGEEVRTDRFTMTPGGGGYITAVGVGRLGGGEGVRAYGGGGRSGEGGVGRGGGIRGVADIFKKKDVSACLRSMIIILQHHG